MRLEIIVGHRFHIPFRYKLSHSFLKGIKPVTNDDDWFWFGYFLSEYVE